MALYEIIEDDFHSIDANIPAGNAPDWNYLTGSSTILTFADTSADQDIVLTAGSSATDAFLANVRAPTTVNQMAEIKCLFASSPGSNTRTGVFLRYIDTNNCIIGRINHNTKRLEVIERIAGVDNVIANPSTVSSATGASVKLEVIGQRIRWWYEPHRFRAQDMPPDDAADLATVATVPGEWGIYVHSNGTGSGLEVQQFYARDLPSKFMQPPDLFLSDASGITPKFVPVTCALVTPQDQPAQWEWEVCPNDADDFAEVYHDTCIASVTERVFFVRPGYSYTVRCRAMKKSGFIYPWATATFTASGVKSGVTSDTMPDDDWPGIDPDYVLSRDQTANVGAVMSDTGRERIASPWVRPRNSWTLKFENRQRSEIQKIMDFFDRMEGRTKPFKWLHPTSGEQFAVRFDTEELTAKVDDEGSDSPIFSLEVPIKELAVGVVGSINLSLTLDSSLI